MLGVLATELTCSTGRRRNSDTSVTTTGVTAALISVPAPHSRDARNDAAAEATLAMTSVWIEMPPLDGFSLFGGLTTPLLNADQPPILSSLAIHRSFGPWAPRPLASRPELA
jgi:hypothetical protein